MTSNEVPLGVVAERSQALHGNNFVLPVALAVIELGQAVVRTPDVRDALKGFLPENRILTGLERLCTPMRVMTELPYTGRPNPRLFERRSSAYWDFVVPFVIENLPSLRDNQ